MNDNCSWSKGQRSRSQGHAQEIYADKGFGIGDAREQTTLNRRRSPIKLYSERQIRVEDYKNVIFFEPLLTGHVIRRMRGVCVRIYNGNQWETLSLITQERIGVAASNLVGIIDVGVDVCGILSRSVGQTNRK